MLKMLPWVGAFVILIAASCSPGGQGTEDQYYQAYVDAQLELTDMGNQLDSTLVRIRDLEGAIDIAKAEIDGAEVSTSEAQMMAARDPASAEFHAVQALDCIRRAKSVLTEVRP